MSSSKTAIASSVRQAANAVLTALLLFQGLLSVGFMPAYADDQGFLIELCSGVSEKSIRIDAEAKTSQPSEHKLAGENCDFAFSSALDDLLFKTEPQNFDLIISSAGLGFLPTDDTFLSSSLLSGRHTRAPPA